MEWYQYFSGFWTGVLEQNIKDETIHFQGI
jgi:hypothetical protein